MTVERPAPSAISLAYRAVGRIAGVFLPPPAEPLATDELWRSTCFEAFLKPEGGEAYLELNFAPSSRWAAYRFTGYPGGHGGHRDRRAAHRSSPPAPTALEIDVALDLAGHLPPGPCRLAISAVIEETNGDRSYWALAHAPGRPDFHDAAALPRTFRSDHRNAPCTSASTASGRPRPPRAAAGPPRRPARPSGLGDRRPDPLARRAGRLPGDHAHRRLRPAARPARRQAGQHGREPGLPRSGARRPGVQPLRRGAPPHRRDDADAFDVMLSTCRTSAAASTPSSPRCGTCWRPPRGRQVGLGARPAEPRRPPGRGPAPSARLGELRRRRAAADAPRPDAGRARRLVRRDPEARRRLPGDRDGGLGARRRARLRLAAGRARLDQPQPQRPQPLDGPRLRRHGDAGGRRPFRKAAAPPARWSCSARRTSTPAP